MSAAVARSLAISILEDFDCFDAVHGEMVWHHRDGYRCCEIEVFPKQDEVNEGGFGNLLRLPLGVHRRTGQEGFFVDLHQGYGVPFAADDPATVLAQGSVR